MKSRILCWILCISIALGFFYGGDFIKEKLSQEKTPVYVYAHEDMESGFKRALKMAGMKSTHKIVMTDDETKANIVVTTQKEYNSEYEKIAFSPFVVAYNKEDNYASKMKKSGLLIHSKYSEEEDGYLEIDFLQVINEVIGNGSWEKFGLPNKGNLEVFYPAESTPYWSDFYDFMLVTVNNGKYPETEEEMKNAMEQIEKFENSKYTEAVKDFKDKIRRTEGFSANSLWIIPEKLAEDLTTESTKNARLFYPTITTYLNYYIKCDEIGSKIKSCFNEGGFSGATFYSRLNTWDFRNSEYPKIDSISDYLYYEKDSYNVLILEKDRIKPISEKT